MSSYSENTQHMSASVVTAWGNRRRQGGATWTHLGHVPFCTLCPLRRPLPTQGLQGPVSWPPSPSPNKETSLAQNKVSFPGVVTHTVCVVMSLGPPTSGRPPTPPFTSGLGSLVGPPGLLGVVGAPLLWARRESPGLQLGNSAEEYCGILHFPKMATTTSPTPNTLMVHLGEIL